MIKLLIGGSPCTRWSIAQTKDRETEPSGIGWELFLNYRTARDKYKPDFFLYENNKSMSPAIRTQITTELGVEPILINSALVSAQNRQRLYWAGKRNQDGTYSELKVTQPEDRGILLRDILESGVCWREKGYTLKANYTNAGAVNGVCGQHFPATMAAEPIRIGTIESGTETTHDSKPFRVYSPDGKSVTIQGEAGGIGAKTGLYAVPIEVEKQTGAGIVEPIRVANINGGGQGNRIYRTDAKSCAIKAQSGGLGGHGQGLYAIPIPLEYTPLQSCNVVITDQNIKCVYEDGRGTAQGYTVYFDDVKSPSVITGHAHKMKVIEPATGKEHPVYEVRAGLITIKEKQYPIKLADGFYIVRKLTVAECKRLQTVPDNYIFPVSNSQAYKMLGNGWTVDVVAHILSHIPGITEEPVEVLSMYDGMSCGHIALDKLGAEVTRYYATEIDKYAVQTTQENFPHTIQCGDAFAVRVDDWKLEGAEK